MDPQQLKTILEQYKAGVLSEDDVLLKLREAPFEDLGYAKLDTHRALRQGMPEVIYGAGKTPEQILGITKAAVSTGQKVVLITRMSDEAAEYIRSHAAFADSKDSQKRCSSIPASLAEVHDAGKSTTNKSGTAEAFTVTPIQPAAPRQNISPTAKAFSVNSAKIASAESTAGTDYSDQSTPGVPFQYDPLSHIGIVGNIPKPDGKGIIAVVTGGTSDMPVAEEAAKTAEVYGNQVVRIYDVGVAGIHRLFAHVDDLMRARVVISIAGMEGALTSVVGGLVNVPVIAVPTSVGYGASFHGLSALLSMLNSCASGVSVVNIDNGFGAGYQASMINHL